MAAKTKQEAAEKAYDAYKDFINLCKLLFGKTPVESITDIDSSSPYYTIAQDIAKEFKIDWSEITPEDSNELMLALLDDVFNRINVDERYEYVLSITAKDKGKDKEQK